MERNKPDMEIKNEHDYDIVVIGAGHAGVEASLACARMGQKTLLLTLNLDSVGLMPCNPAIGGTGKGHLVREIDALGGEMGLAADDTLIQMRMLNTGKGPAVHSLRAQMDKRRYHERVKRAMEQQENLTLVQGEASRFLTEGGRISGVETAEGFVYPCRAAVVCAGCLYEKQDTHRRVFPQQRPRGASAERDAVRRAQGARRTAANGSKRVRPRESTGLSLDYDEMERQDGDVPTPTFSFLNGRLELRANALLPDLYQRGNTPRLFRKTCTVPRCTAERSTQRARATAPALRTRSSDLRTRSATRSLLSRKGKATNEMYVQGMSTSLPGDVQIAMLRSMPGLHRCEVDAPWLRN